MPYSRRHFISTVPPLTLGSFLLPQSASAKTKSKLEFSSESPVTGLATGEALPLPNEEIPGFLT